VNPPAWSTACPDWERRIVAGESLIPFPPLFPAAAASALAIFDRLRMMDAAGGPTLGEVSRPWVRDFVGAIFGAYDEETGRRLITEFFLLISKKNGKSTDAAGIMATALIENWRDLGEFMILAPTVKVAGNSYDPLAAMIRADEELSDLLHIADHTKTITHRTTKATLKVIAAESSSVAGAKGVGVFIDELWIFGERADAENMLREATGGLMSRPEGFTIYATTQSDEPPAGVFAQKLAYARGVRDGEIVDPGFLPLLYEHPKAILDAKKYLDPKTFYITNPNLGASVDERTIEREYRKAQIEGPKSMQGFLAKHLNVQIGLALTAGRWSGADHWEANAEPVLTLAELFRRSDVLEIGIDGGGLDDLLGLCVLGREIDTGHWLCWSHAWAHEVALERNKQEAPRFRDYERDGDLTIVDKPGKDVDAVAKIVWECEESGLLDRIGVDQAGISAIVKAITDLGIKLERIVGIPQGWKLSGAIKTTERKLAAGELRHGGTRLMNYAVANAKARPRGNATVITKEDSGNAKIDPLAALFDAVALLTDDPKPRAKRFQFIVAGPGGRASRPAA
jgi:phage terminase large subunit-like protein